MTPQEQQHLFFNRVLSDPVDSRPRWAYPYERPAATRVVTPTAGTVRNRSVSINELNNLPVEQQQQAHMNENQWLRYIAQEIDLAWRPVFVKHKTIFSVPRALFEVRPRSYCPRVVTIGPLCRKLEPSPMDRCKALCIKEFMGRRAMPLNELMNYTIPDPENLRNVYFGLPKYNTETLQLLLTMDSVFIHEFLFFLSRDSNPEDEVCGYMYSFLNNQITMSQVTRDLFLVGNQVPISFLQRLTELPNGDLALDDLLHCLEYLIFISNPFCMSHLSSDSYHKDLMEVIPGVSFLECEHLLDCLYMACVRMPKGESPQEFNKPSCRLPTASALSKVGIKFKARKGNTSVVRYHKKSLRLDLPRLVIFDETEDILRNLIAYELTSKVGGELCGYAVIMDSLIDTVEDLAILTRAGVLQNHLGSDERLLRMWNEMCINISEHSSERWEVMIGAIMTHYNSNWRIMYVEFYSKFFSRPWLWLSTVAAILLLGMSALQTIYSVLSYYHG
eukprot:c20730_g1_i1 orf=293-1801(+)